MIERLVLACLATALFVSPSLAGEEVAWLYVGAPRYCIDEWQVCDLESQVVNAGNSFTCGYLPPRFAITGPPVVASFVAGDRIWLGGTWETSEQKPVPPSDVLRLYADQVPLTVEVGPTPALDVRRAAGTFAESTHNPSWLLDSTNLQPGFYALRATLPPEIAPRDPRYRRGPAVRFWIEPAGTEAAALERLSRRVHAAWQRCTSMDAPDAALWLRRVVEAGEELIAATPHGYYDAALVADAYRRLGDLTSAQRVARYAWQSLLATPYCRGEIFGADVPYLVVSTYTEAFGAPPPDHKAALEALSRPYAKGGLPCTLEELVCERQRRDFPGKRIEHWFCLPDQQRPIRFQDWVTGENPWKTAPGQP
ncbi:MAG: hypothetical protein HYV63_16630 [Candidatus Schekmanbacteria bacterium]|nr:hypothetical protein [Candidatus Schekmanbacteria bacterium]